MTGTADDVLLRKGQKLEQGPVRPDDPLAIVENHDHVLDGVQDVTPVAGRQAVFQPIFPPLQGKEHSVLLSDILQDFFTIPFVRFSAGPSSRGIFRNPPATIAAAKGAGAVTLNYGLFVNTIVNFLIIAFAIFFVVRSINQLKKKEEAPPAVPTTKECPHCLSTIPIQAKKCGHCTSDLKAA